MKFNRHVTTHVPVTFNKFLHQLFVISVTFISQKSINHTSKCDDIDIQQNEDIFFLLFYYICAFHNNNRSQGNIFIKSFASISAQLLNSLQLWRCKSDNRWLGHHIRAYIGGWPRSTPETGVVGLRLSFEKSGLNTYEASVTPFASGKAEQHIGIMNGFGSSKLLLSYMPNHYRVGLAINMISSGTEQDHSQSKIM